MRLALLIGVTDEDPQQSLQPGPSLDAIEALLGQLGGWKITRLERQRADRATILAELARLEAAVEPDDCVLLYCVGHGGVVHIHDLPPPLGGRSVFYFTSARTGGWRFEGVLDIEFSLALAAIDRVCGNVTFIIDSCYSALVVRGPAWACHESPAWLRELATRLPPPQDCDPSSHPSIVRLAGSSSLRMSYADRREDGHVGRLTALVCELVREAELRTDRLSWDALAHRAREQAIWRLGCEEQWVTLAGPRMRLLFSRQEAPPLRTVGFVPDESGDGGWVRAGVLQGVRVGDEWTLTELTLDEQLRPRARARMRVTEVDLNRARLESITAGVDMRAIPPGTSAVLARVAERERVVVDGPPALREAVERSTWLCVGEQPEHALASIYARNERLDVQASAAEFNLRFDARGLAAAIERVEDWARARRLHAVASLRASGDSHGPLTLQVERERGPRQRAEPLALDCVHRFRAGERVCLTIRCTGTSDGWFISPILIDVAGRPRLLEAAEPDGREVVSGDRVTLGDHPHRQQRGIELSWPAEAESDPERVRPLTIIVLASRRPIPLAHLLALPERAVPTDEPRRRRLRMRGHLSQPRPRLGPVLATDWAAWIVRLELERLA